MDIKIEPFELEDIPRLLGWINSEEFMMQWSGPYFSYPLDASQLEDYVRSAQEKPVKRVIFRVRDLSQDRIVGHIELNNIDWRNLAASISKVLVGPEDLRGTGIGKQMVSLLLEYAFSELSLHRIDLKVFDDNYSAIRCYEENGFIKEGHLRDFRKVGSKYRSSYLMSILESEWRAKKENILLTGEKPL
jgi:RimJ/RimL family protein N-acetyltransferase